MSFSFPNGFFDFMAEFQSIALTRAGEDSRRRAQDNLIDFRRLFIVLRERWLGGILLAAAISGLVGWVLWHQTPVFAATSTLLVERTSDRVVDIKQVVDNSVDSTLTDALLLTHIQQIKSHTFLVRVIASLKPEERAAMLAPYPDKKPLAALRDDRTVHEDGRLEDLITTGLKIERAGRTLLITLTMRHRDPVVAQLMANRLVDEYILFLIDRSTASNDSALTFLNGQAEELRRKLEAAELKVQEYREKYNLFFIEQNQSIVVERLRTLSTSVTQARVHRLELDAQLTQAERIAKGEGDARSLASRPEFTAFASVQRQIDELRARHDVLAERYGRRHPLMQDNATTLETLEKLRVQQLSAALSDMRNQRDKAVTDEKQLGLELAAVEKESLRFDQLAVDYNFLRREVETTRGTYSQILGRLNETTVSSRLQNTNIKFVDRAGLPDTPVEPNRIKVLLVTILLGGIILVGYPLTADAFDTRVKTWFDIESHLHAPLIGEIRNVPGIPPKKRAYVVAESLDDDVAEAFRALHNQVQLSSKIKGAKTILVTSTVPSEGKSFVACNLGASFAAHGKKTLLIDADFRRPSLHRAFGVPNENGTLKWLTLGVPLEGAAIANKALGIKEVSPGLFLLPTGGESRKLTEMLQGGALVELVKALQREFDVVLIDTSPSGVFPDAEACCDFADELVYVCRHATASRLHIQQTLDRLRQRDISFLGVVFNGMPRSGGYHLSGWGHARKHYKGYYAKTR
jgi:polysaccharide biosynthesis transport protein